MSVFVEQKATEYSAQAKQVTLFFAKLKAGSEPESEVLAFVEECKGYVKGAQYEAFLLNVVPALSSAIEQGEIKSVECCVNLLCSLLRKVKGKEPKNQIVQKMIDSVVSKSDHRIDFRLQILVNLFNVFPEDSVNRFQAFRALLFFANENNAATPQLIRQFSKVDGWLKKWNATPEQCREIYMLMRDTHISAEQLVAAHQKMISYLKTYENGDEITEDATAEAVKAAVEAVRLPGVTKCDELLSLKALKSLEKTKPLVFELLRLFTEENLDAFQTFHKENSAFLEEVGLDYGECEKKIRLLSFSSVAQGKEEVSFDEVIEVLKIPPEEVEMWVIQAITENVVTAKIDQLNRRIIIKRTTQRVFGQAEWEQLDNQIKQWRNNVADLLKMVDGQKERTTKLMEERIGALSTAEE